MALYLEVIEGPNSGAKFSIKEGTRIGRSKGEILIKDPKVSSLHAQVELTPQGQLVLVDKDSSNGLRVNNQKVRRIALMPGVRFGVGKTLFRVIEISQVDRSSGDSEIISRNPDKPNWQKALLKGLESLPPQTASLKNNMRPFSRPFHLHFTHGIQADTSLTIGFGPRQAGSEGLDILLQDPAALPLTFELQPDQESVRITSHCDRVFVNEKFLTSELLRDGDTIRFGQSVILYKVIRES